MWQYLDLLDQAESTVIWEARIKGAYSGEAVKELIASEEAADDERFHKLARLMGAEEDDG